MKPVSERINPLRLVLMPKALTSMLISFSRQEGILPLIKGLKAFTAGDYTKALEDKLSFRLEDPVKKRMAATLLDFLTECGFISHTGPSFEYRAYGEVRDDELALTAAERALLDGYLRGELDFFTTCLKEAGGFLKGKKTPFSFSSRCEPLWDGFLGNPEFTFMRSLLLKLMDVRDCSEFKVLDLCYGLGHGLAGIVSQYPSATVSALDYRGVYRPAVEGRLKRLAGSPNIEFINGGWEGFGHRLPAGDGSFDAVHFTCADPYVPKEARLDVYKELHRVIKPGGALGVLTWCYPDRERLFVKNPWVRRQILAHDFIESVCAGWQGFHGVADTRSTFEKAGFKPKKTVLPIEPSIRSALWVMERC